MYTWQYKVPSSVQALAYFVTWKHKDPANIELPNAYTAKQYTGVYAWCEHGNWRKSNSYTEILYIYIYMKRGGSNTEV